MAAPRSASCHAKTFFPFKSLGRNEMMVSVKKEIAKLTANREFTRYEKSAFSCSPSHC